MTLFEQWQKLLDSQTDATFEAFWQKYSAAEDTYQADRTALIIPGDLFSQFPDPVVDFFLGDHFFDTVCHLSLLTFQ